MTRREDAGNAEHFQIFPTRSGAKSAAPFGFRSMGRLIENNARQDLRVLPCACFLPSNPMDRNRMD
ncbi:hypothetical protein CO661_05435 [Sinorhizobium fredii]|uniref:Uncharacterized protein n=1 Tax=Rhizobium fredii TaxID=380 RepID=A0A2A6M4G2_RHIFR|nr:hypothetical protein [Sinorhizobium fredii]MQX12719.1 hypothetical protein [Sinorhizobium fredii]PDT49457.1 hypothetical protein CO661_05435 [Sinorhizobium fredii]UTY51500.1 hypothetical protein EPK84_23370 [Sinorhizobium fredii]